MKYLSYLCIFLLSANLCLAETNEEFNELVKTYSTSESAPVIITSSAKEEFIKNGKKWNWLKQEGYSIGYAENENIELTLKAFEKNYKLYQSSLPDAIEGESLTWKIRASEISGMGKAFEQQCRTFLESTENLQGEITIYSSLFMPQKVNCKLMVFAFTVNNVSFKKAKRARTLVIVKRR